MQNRLRDFFAELFFRRELSYWTRWARNAESMRLSKLRKLKKRGSQLRARIDKLNHTAEQRLRMPRIGSDAIHSRLYSDWAWRPALWKLPLVPAGKAPLHNKDSIGSEATIFHDSSRSEIAVRQVRNRQSTDLAPFGIQLDVFAFEGSFLSLVVDLPVEAVEGLKQNHLICLDTIVELERPIVITARLNVMHGPNTEQIVRELPLYDSEVMVEFDLSYTDLNEKRVERMWVDLIFEEPEFNRIELRDLTFSRRPRTQI
ncbi:MULTISPECIES: DUF6478 family protein [Halocynthiibacter]|uniref:DUF6478 family protein n=1 Tax=Halocynthiibacter halioticoli TaxID=2986804 RepID=A0AAE3J1W2_9RHOB|nr:MULTISPECIES: DUF6478 family protein [Halocynthiibacter]MCV6825874.1 DUF6478 family protein [Halocynthiibacter halioticoli]MCW4058875.1 DUF6478 family protein [Halocynthiibacter sp. SDUM655004]